MLSLSLKSKVNMHAFWWVIVSSVNILLLTIVYRAAYFTSVSTAIFSVSNIFVAVLIRNELVLHFLYCLAVSASKGSNRGRYYLNSSVHYIGGVHAACATWGVLWLLFDGFNQLGNPLDPLSMAAASDAISIAVTSMLGTLLVIILLTAMPSFRERFHDVFEMNHRYLGWWCLGVLVLHQARFQFVSALSQAYPLQSLLFNPVLLMIAGIVFSVCLPWVSMQCFDDFTMQCPSKGVLVITVPGSGEVGSFARISLDGVEWHSFSVAGTSVNEKTGRSEIRLIVGSSGDWTRGLIAQVERGRLPKKLWVRRVKPPGFMFSINAYSRVVVVATGAGIAPVLPHAVANASKLCIVWVGSNHQETYGQEIFSILSAHPRCNIFDTHKYGRPNVEQLAIQAVSEFDAQAVFCVSNPAVTKKVVGACLDEGIPAYGATWDS